MKLFLLQEYAESRYFTGVMDRLRLPMSFMALIFILTALVPLFPPEAAAISASWSAWSKPHDLYLQQDYSAALLELQKQSSETPEYYYNCGTLYLHLKNWSHAVGYLEKANRLLPRHSDIQANLKIARDQLSQQIGMDKLDPASDSLDHLSDRISLDEVRATLGLFATLTLLLWLRAYMRSRNLKRMILHPSGTMAFIALLISVCLYLIEQRGNERKPAILLKLQTVRSGPSHQYLDLGQVPAGTKIRILGKPIQVEEGMWQRIQFSSDEQGWISTESLILL